MKHWVTPAILIVVMGFSCARPQTVRMRVLHAGSLAVPFRSAAKAFMERNPGVEVELEAHGSRTAARQISDLGRRADVMASADARVIRNLLIPDHAEWCIEFALNEMVIMYGDHSRFHREINADNWYRVLLRNHVEYGHSDPNADPCGYRTILTWKLAEKYYAGKDPEAMNLAARLESGMPLRNMRSKETDLIALLEAGELDYIFIYRSVAEQHRAPFLTLPDEINLKSSAHAEEYSRAHVVLTGRNPGEKIVMRGAPMVYGVTLPRNAEHPELGIRFIAFLLSEDGRKIMRDNGQPPLYPPRADHPGRLPSQLAVFFQQADQSEK